MESEAREQKLCELMALGAAAFEKPDVSAALLHYRSALWLASEAPDAHHTQSTECREYLMALLLLSGIVREEAVPHRVAELAAWCTHCKLQPQHLALVLRMAINTAAKIKNYASVVQFAERLLVLRPGQEMTTLAQTATRVSLARGATDAIRLQYEPRRSWLLCPASLEPIYKDEATLVVHCAHCKCECKAHFAGQLCSLCEQAPLGQPVLSHVRQQQQQAQQPAPQDDWSKEELEIYNELAQALGVSA